MKRILLLFLLISTFLSSCYFEEYNEIEFLGKWDVVWEERKQNRNQQILFGEVDFLQNGMVEFTGFGYGGNPYLEDTVNALLNYYHVNDTLFTTQAGAAEGLKYRILSLDTENIVLQLNEEIFLNLNRKKRGLVRGYEL